MQQRKTIYIATGIMAIAFSPIFLYIIEFGFNKDWSINLLLSNEQNTWSQFGGFVGGTVGTIFSGLACLGVFFTYKEQRKQFSDNNKKFQNAELRQQLLVIKTEIDFILDINLESVKIYNRGIYFHELLETLHIHSCQGFISTRREYPSDKRSFKFKPQPRFGAFQSDTNALPIVKKLNRRFNDLIHCLDLVKVNDNSDVSLDFYKKRFHQEAQYLWVLGIIDKDTLSRHFIIDNVQGEVS